MPKRTWILLAGALVVAAVVLVSTTGLPFSSAEQATATPTRTPKPYGASPTPQATLALEVPTAAPTIAPSATNLPSPAPVPPSPTTEPLTPTPLPLTATPAPTVALPAQAQPQPEPTIASPTEVPAPATDYVISELRVLGLGENNGGIEGPGSGRTIFVNVVDQAGSPVNGAVIVSASEYPVKAVSGDKGPGKAEVLMGHEVFRLKVDSVGGTTVTSEVSHNLSLVSPMPQDIAGRLGSACPTPDQCPLPPYKHFSYVITFRRTH